MWIDMSIHFIHEIFFKNGNRMFSLFLLKHLFLRLHSLCKLLWRWQRRTDFFPFFMTFWSAFSILLLLCPFISSPLSELLDITISSFSPPRTLREIQLSFCCPFPRNTCRIRRHVLPVQPHTCFGLFLCVTAKILRYLQWEESTTFFQISLGASVHEMNSLPRHLYFWGFWCPECSVLKLFSVTKP